MRLVGVVKGRHINVTILPHIFAIFQLYVWSEFQPLHMNRAHITKIGKGGGGAYV